MNFPRRGLWHRDRHINGTLLLVVGLFAALLAPVAWLAWPVVGDPSEDFMQRRGQVAQVQTTHEWQTADSRYRQLSLLSSTGLQIEATVRQPLQSNKPQPLILLLGGYGTGRDAAELVSETSNLVVASISYPYRGPDKIDGWRWLWHFDEVQQAILDTTPALLLVLDFLTQQDYIDSRQIELIGVSFGAFFVSVAGAKDERISRVWLIQGAAEPQAIYEYRLRDRIRFAPLRVLASQLLAFLTASEELAPERWVGRISPRPVVAINSRNDPAYPPSSVATLHASLREPYEVEWMRGEHVTPARREVISEINSRVLKRIRAESVTESQKP